MVGFQFGGDGSLSTVYEVFQHVVGEGFFEDCQHPGEKGDIDVDFRKTEVTAIRLHETEITGTGQNRAAGKNMSVDGGNDRHGVEQNTFVNLVQAV